MLLEEIEKGTVALESSYFLKWFKDKYNLEDAAIPLIGIYPKEMKTHLHRNLRECA